MYKHIIDFIKELYSTDEFIPLHEPCFVGNEKKYLNECIDSTFVSSVGKFVDQFEEEVCKYTGAKHAVATVNGTAALHIALLMAGVQKEDEVITQPLTFIATCNAISYLGAYPVFVDVDMDTLGLSPKKLEQFLITNTEMVNGVCINKTSRRTIKAVVPMHTFGLAVEMDDLIQVCLKYNLQIVEDAAESLGSFYKGNHTGTIGRLGTLSFNGNKTITIPHRWDYEHDMIAYNYRLPNLNSALGCAQMENLPIFIERKRELAALYYEFFKEEDVKFITESKNSKSNYWLNAVLFKSPEEKNTFLEETNNNLVMTRPIWKLMNHLTMYENAQCGDLGNAKWLEDRIVNIPSSVRI